MSSNYECGMYQQLMEVMFRLDPVYFASLII